MCNCVYYVHVRSVYIIYALDKCCTWVLYNNICGMLRGRLLRKSNAHIHDVHTSLDVVLWTIIAQPNRKGAL